jgi:hypothetical protein
MRFTKMAKMRFTSHKLVGVSLVRRSTDSGVVMEKESIIAVPSIPTRLKRSRKEIEPKMIVVKRSRRGGP